MVNIGKKRQASNDNKKKREIKIKNKERRELERESERVLSLANSAKT